MAAILGGVQRSSLAGAHAANAANDRISPSLHIEGVAGTRPNATTANLTVLDIYALLPYGGGDLDLFQLRLGLQDGATSAFFTYVDGAASSDEFSAEILRDDPPVFDSSDGFLNTGDSVKLTANLTQAGMTLPPRSTLSIHLLPMVGQPSRIDVTTPATYAGALRIELF